MSHCVDRRVHQKAGVWSLAVDVSIMGWNGRYHWLWDDISCSVEIMTLPFRHLMFFLF